MPLAQHLEGEVVGAPHADRVPPRAGETRPATSGPSRARAGLEGLDSLVGDDTPGVLQARLDVITLEPRVTGQDRVHGVTDGEHPEDVLHREAAPADDGLAPEDLGVVRDSLEQASLGHREPPPSIYPRGRGAAHFESFPSVASWAEIALSTAPRSDRDGRERLCHYILRPPLALHRLSRGEDGGLLYRMKRSRHGSLWLSLTPEGLLARLATLVPPPRVHAVRYHGVFAPHAGLRSRVVPDPPEDPAPS